MWTPEWYVREIKLPRTVDGAVIPNDDGTFDIYLNVLSPYEQREKWLRHEVRHITENHFYRAMGLAAAEREADGAAAEPAAGVSVPKAEERAPAEGEILCFKSLDAMLAYYRADVSRVYRDYAGV